MEETTDEDKADVIRGRMIMKSKPKFKKILSVLIIFAIAALCIVFVSVSVSNSREQMSYVDFSKYLDAGKVEAVTFKSDHIEFTLNENTTVYYTDNPDYDGFKEKLLLSGVNVTDERMQEDVLTEVTNVLFNILFLGVIVFAVYKIIEYNRKTFKVVKHTGVTFDNIAGMEHLKKDMLYAVDMLKNPLKYAKEGIRAPKGIIFEGPPGNGKTLFAKALAEEADVNFIATKGADFQSALMSMGARKIKMLFKKAQRHKPCIIFIDEFDSIGERRNYAGTGIDKENNRIITSMLNEMDGFNNSGNVLVIAATNSYNSLDPALIRPGRFDLKYNIGNPDEKTRKELIRIYTVNKHLSNELSDDVLSGIFDGLSCAAVETILNEASTIARATGSNEITLNDIAEAANKANLKLKIKIK